MSRVGILQRLFGRQSSDLPSPGPEHHPGRVSTRPLLDVVLYGGSHDLEVVGESYYQEALWRVVGGQTTERVRTDVQAVLVAESDNPHDADAISVWIGGM